MREILLCALLSAAAHAAAIHGTVVENQSGRPLAHASVTLSPVPGTPGSRQVVRTSRYGTFEFSRLPAGKYLLSASRAGFMTAQYGQKQWRASGSPITIAEDDTTTLTLRLPRFGVITGTVLDENDVGMPEFDVVAYKNTRPPQIAARATSDDRGIFRIYGLEPGSYLIRSAAKDFDGDSYLPTFAKETDLLDQAYAYDVDFDTEVDRADVRPMPGKLYTLTVVLTTAPPATGPAITLASEMGTQTADGMGHEFKALPPGEYEIFAQASMGRLGGVQGNYMKIELGGNRTVEMALYPVAPTIFSFEGGPSASSILLYARRKNLAGAAKAEELKLVNNRVQLAAGPWEVAIAPNDGFYASSFSGTRSSEGRAEGWNEFFVGAGGAGVRFTLSTDPGAVTGTVRSGDDPVAGAPVFLESSDLPADRRVIDPLVAVTDLQGQYRFSGLAPGNYRVLSSFDFQKPDAAAMTAAGAIAVRVGQGRESRQDLELYGDRN